MNSILFVLLDAWDNVESDIWNANYILDTLCTTLAAIFGLIGAIKIYNRWQLRSTMYNEPAADIALWFGGCVFFIVGKVILKAIL